MQQNPVFARLNPDNVLIRTKYKHNCTQNKIPYKSNHECHRKVIFVKWDNDHWLAVKCSAKVFPGTLNLLKTITLLKNLSMTIKDSEEILANILKNQ